MASFPPADLTAAKNQPTDAFTYGKYRGVSTSDAWRWACAPLPSCAGLAWPGYATTAVPATIGGRKVIIQPWMGNCQQLFGRSDFPGGFGGEVGIYVQVPRDRPLPDLALLPLPAQLMLRAAQAFGGDHLWWPDPDCQFDMEMKILNPKTGRPMLEVKTSKPTYWLNGWLSPESYAEYVADVKGEVPFAPSAYQMVYTVAGVKRGWHGAGWEG